MKLLDRSEIPSEYYYYRSHSKAFFAYIKEKILGKCIVVDENEGYGYIYHFFGGFFSYSSFEKCDITPSRALLARYGMKRGIILWSGWRKSHPGEGFWIRLGYLFSRKFHHSTRSAFSILDTPEYWKKWSSGPRGHRGKILRNIEEGIINIDANGTLDMFASAYKKTRVLHGWRNYLLARQRFLSENYPENIRIYLAYVDGECLAGAIFLDDYPTSTYLIAFQDDRGKSYNLGLALIDRWFLESQKLGYKYLELDHMRDTLDSLSYRGYTEFKSGIADYELKFHSVYIGII